MTRATGQTENGTDSNSAVNLFWTGGWDSTFRLLQLGIARGRKVQTFYVIDPARASVLMELHAMHRIKNALFSRYPATRNLLSPTIFKDVGDIRANAGITEVYARRFSGESRLGPQYEWLSRFCAESKIDDMEMCIEKGDVNNEPHDALAEILVRSELGGECCYVVDERFIGSDEYLMFGRFRFPVYGLSKRDMGRIAREMKFADLMEMTWFCHHPSRQLHPCGVCYPCSLVMEEGMGKRMPLSSRLRYHLGLARRLRSYTAKHPGLRAAIKRVRGDR